MKIDRIIGQVSIAPGVGTRSNAKSPPGVWGWGMKLTGALQSQSMVLVNALESN